MEQAIQSKCGNRTHVRGNCACKPKCAVCGHGPHAGIHLGCVDDPARAFGHAYSPGQHFGATYYARNQPEE
jgi:hypothetical protein